MKRVNKKETSLLAMVLLGFAIGTAHAELVALWEFERSTGAEAYDSSHYGNNGIFEGNPKRVAGRYGRAIEFDGRTWVSLAPPPELLVSSGITIACWVNPSKLNGIQSFLGLEGSYAFKAAGERISFTTPGISDHYSSNITLEAGTWQHVAVTFLPEQTEGLLFYLNGIETDRMTSSTMNTGRGSLLIANNQWGETYAGLIDDVCVYNHVLDQDEIKRLYDREGKLPTSRGYVAELTREVESIAKEMQPKEAIIAIDKKIHEYTKWRESNLGHIKSKDNQISSDVYFLLAEAKEATGAPKPDIVAAYKRSVSRPHQPLKRLPLALSWLLKNLSTMEYHEVVKDCIRNSNNPSDIIYSVTKQFESEKNWAGYELFLDAVFAEASYPTSFARIVTKSLEHEGAWPGKFSEYCQNKPELTQYLFLQDEEVARRYIAKQQFGKAAETYRNIIDQCGPRQHRAVYDLKLSECLFSGDQYEDAIQALDWIMKHRENTGQVLLCKAHILQGQAYAHQGNIDQAVETFLRLMIEYPKAEEASKACFLIGYSRMIQGNFDEAKEAFKIVAKEYPNVEYADRSRSYIDRIKQMTE